MFKLSDIKKLIRSKSLDYVLNARPGAYSEDLKMYHWKGHKVRYRAGKADAGALYEILIRPSVILRPNKFFFKRKKLEYWIPREVDPTVILDIGGNIGTTTVYYSHMFPNAKIFTFEPVASNYEVLKLNVSELPNVKTFNVGLGNKDEITEIYMCEDHDNTGGYSMFNLEVDKSQKETITVKNSQSFLKEIGANKVDLIKIDTEGSEYNILTTMDPEILSNVRWIIGELHGERDFELLAYLSQWFDIDMKKSMRSRLFNFSARNKNYAKSIPWRY